MFGTEKSNFPPQQITKNLVIIFCRIRFEPSKLNLNRIRGELKSKSRNYDRGFNKNRKKNLISATMNNFNDAITKLNEKLEQNF